MFESMIWFWSGRENFVRVLDFSLFSTVFGMALAVFLALASSLSCPSFYAPMAERIDVLTEAQSIVYKLCRFSDLTFEGKGGAIYVARESRGASRASLVVSICCFERCSAHAGGAVFFEGQGFFFVSSVGSGCVARDGGALASARAANLVVNITSAVRTTGGSLDLTDGVQIVLNHNTSRSYNGGVVIGRHDSLDFLFAELTAISLGRCLTLHSNAGPEVIRCVAVCDNIVGSVLYVAGTYTAHHATFRNNILDVLVVFGPGGALTFMGCDMDVRTVSSTQEDAEIHPFVVADARPDAGCSAPQIRARVLNDLSWTACSFNETDSMTVSDPGDLSLVFSATGGITTSLTLRSEIPPTGY
jgi:hypothetical protein